MDNLEPIIPQPEQPAPQQVPPAQEENSQQVTAAFTPEAQEQIPPQPQMPPQMPPQQQFPPQYRESPYANAPYMMQQPPYYGYAPNYQMPPQPKPPKAPKAPKQKKQGGVWKTLLATVLTVALVAGSCFITARQINGYWDARNTRERMELQQQIQMLQDQLEDVAKVTDGMSVSGTPAATVSDSLTPSQVYAKNVGSVVAISNQGTTNYFGQASETASSGSGFILTEDGYVVSNYHVVSGATKLTVILHDGTEYPATLVGGDENNDIALLKVDATGLQPVTLGSSDDLVVGDQVVAIGNPLGELTSTQTVGYISAKDRDITTDGTTINMMQTDAAINPGNSGGPLFNMKGEVVGITTAKYSGTTNSGASLEGLGFAIPIDDVAGMLGDLKDHGYVTGAYLGISVRSMDPDVAKAYGLPTGSQVVTVEEGSCALEAGMQEMDIIIKLGDYEVSDNNDLLRALRKYNPDDTVTVVVWRSGAYKELTVTLDAKPAPTE